MKLYLILFILLFFNIEQKNIEGEYYNHFGSNLKINSDKTFIYTWNFDLASSWSKGKWKIKNDTVYFQTIPIYDTLRRPNFKDSLVLSVNQKPELITDYSIIYIEALSSGGQNRQLMNSKLYFDGEKLIEIKENGKLNTKKVKDFWQNKEHPTWFIKVK